MRVRELRWSDFDDLREAYYLLYDERETSSPSIGITLFHTKPTDASEVEWFSNVYRKVLAGDAVCRVAEVDGHVIGNCIVQRDGPAVGHETGHIGVLGILVHRDHRGAGAGDALLREVLAACRGTFEILFLSVFSVNVRAIALYTRFGFVPVGHLAGTVRRGDRYFDEEFMALDLRPTHAKS